MNRFILSVKNNKATGCDGIPPEAWKTSVSKGEGTEIMIKLLI
jgi:hypothetical protein